MNSPIPSMVRHGLVFGGGVELAVGGVRIAPEVQYSRSMNTLVYQFFRGADVTRGSNQVQVLVGVSWRVGRR